MRDLTDRHEGARTGRAEVCSVDDAPPAYIESLLRANVGIGMTVDRWEGKRKLSRLRATGDVAAVAGDLATGTPAEQQVAAAMLLR